MTAALRGLHGVQGDHGFDRQPLGDQGLERRHALGVAADPAEADPGAPGSDAAGGAADPAGGGAAGI